MTGDLLEDLVGETPSLSLTVVVANAPLQGALPVTGATHTGSTLYH